MPNGNENKGAPKTQPNYGGRASDARRGYTARPRRTIDWDEIPQDRIGLLVHAVTHAGAAIMLGRTSDGGALSVTVLDGENRIREWPNSVEEFDSLFSWLVGMFGSD